MSPLAAVVILSGLLGLIVGSFLAAVSVRLPLGQGVVLGRSRCMSCDRALSPWHLVPVVSWLALRGRCSSCSAPISPRYPLIELGGGGIGVWAALHGPSLVTIGVTALLGWQLLLIAVIDGENFWLPDVLTLPLIGTGLVASLFLTTGLPWPQMIGAALGFGLLWGLAAVYRLLRKREGLGGGDPFMFAGAGAWVGWMGLPSVLLWACAVGFSVIAARLVVRRRVSGTDRLPFGVYLAVGIWMTWLFGPIGV